MMSDERFIEEYSYLYGYSEKHCIFDKVQGRELYLDEVVSLLNRLNSENEELRENLHNCKLNKNIIREKLKIWQDVHKEYNIYSIKDFEELLNEQDRKNDKLVSDLRKENMQLQKENIFLAKQRSYWKDKRDVAVETFEIDEATAKKIRELEKQNKQLQTELNNYEKISNLLTDDDTEHYDRWIQQIKKYIEKTNEECR